MSEPGFEYYPPPELPPRQSNRQAQGRGLAQPTPEHRHTPEQRPAQSGGRGPSDPQEPVQEAPPAAPGRRMLRITCALLVVVSLAFILRATLFSIRYVRVIGINHLTWQQVASSAGISTSSNYFGLREDKIREGINANRFLTYERMQKVFPSSVILYVKERQPVASIDYIGMSYIMADDGLILASRQQGQSDSSLMRVSGLALRDIREGKLPVSTKSGQIESCIALIQEMYQQGFSAEIVEVNMSEPTQIYLTTRDGYSIHIGDTNELRPKIGTIRAVLTELRRMGLKGGTIEGTIPIVATYIPDKP